ncbi:MAG: cytochrome c [Acidobacteriota bacterium]|nr:cytochrome c [Acidobacteriota bacterium]
MSILKRTRSAPVAAALFIAAVMRMNAQTSPASATPPPAAVNRTGSFVRPAAYPSHPQASPEVLDRGKALYGVNCNFCHGSDARGGEGGPNLLRSEMVLNDKNGEGITAIVQNGRPDQGMPKFPLSAAQISDIAAYIHNFKVGGYDVSRMTPLSILVGDAKAGEVYFNAQCASCHSATGDLKGIASKITDPKALQNFYLMPGGGGRGPRGGGASPYTLSPTTVTVSLPSGEKAEGRLGRIDDFIVSVILPDGTQRSFRRDGDTPEVVIHDPLQPHKNLLPKYTDTDIHNLTSYLVTLK